MQGIITRSAFEKRRERVREQLYNYNIEALFVCDCANRYYLSGFEMGDIHTYSTGGYLLITREGKDILFTDSRYTEAAYAVWENNNVVLYTSPAKDIADYIYKNIKGTIGIEEQTMTVAFYNTMREHNIVAPADGIVPSIRAVKEEEEIELLQQSVALNHKVMEEVEHWLHEGVTEKEIAWKIEQYYKNAGASHLSFSSIVAFGDHSALPHYSPEDGNRVLKQNMPVLIDCGCVYNGYCSDQTRTFWYGDSPSESFRHSYVLVEEVQRKSIESIRAGKTCHDIYIVAYNIFKEHGVESHFTHGLGHGIGIAVHEDPRLRKNCDIPLEHNMVVTVEPGLYYPDWGGIRLEYMVRVLEDGYDIL